MRGRYTFSLTTTSAPASARSQSARSPASQWNAMLSFWPCLSLRSTGAPEAIALNGSIIGGSASYSTSTASAPSAAM